MKKFIVLVAMITIATYAISCAQPTTVNAETGEVVQKSNTLVGESYYVPEAPMSRKMGVLEYQRGDMTYLVMETSRGLTVVNYTLDSIAMVHHCEESLPPGELDVQSPTHIVGVWR